MNFPAKKLQTFVDSDIFLLAQFIFKSYWILKKKKKQIVDAIEKWRKFWLSHETMEFKKWTKNFRRYWKMMEISIPFRNNGVNEFFAFRTIVNDDRNWEKSLHFLSKDFFFFNFLFDKKLFAMEFGVWILLLGKWHGNRKLISSEWKQRETD